MDMKKMAEALAAKKRGGGKAKADEKESGLDLSAKAMIAAFKSGDHKALASALRDAHELCNGEE